MLFLSVLLVMMGGFCLSTFYKDVLLNSLSDERGLGYHAKNIFMTAFGDFGATEEE